MVDASSQQSTEFAILLVRDLVQICGLKRTHFVTRLSLNTNQSVNAIFSGPLLSSPLPSRCSWKRCIQVRLKVSFTCVIQSVSCYHFLCRFQVSDSDLLLFLKVQQTLKLLIKRKTSRIWLSRFEGSQIVAHTISYFE